MATSFEGKYGYIRYWLKAELGKPWAFAYKTKKPLTVISPIDINKPEYMMPVEAALEKNIYCWWCVTAPVSAEIRTDRRVSKFLFSLIYLIKSTFYLLLCNFIFFAFKQR